MLVFAIDRTVGFQKPGVPSPIGWTIPSHVPTVFTCPAHQPIPVWRGPIKSISKVPFSSIRICLRFLTFFYFFFWVPCPSLVFLFHYFDPLGSLAILPLILSQSRSLLRAASMAAARVLGSSLSASSYRSLSLNASIYTSAINACIGPLFRVASSGNTSAARPSIL